MLPLNSRHSIFACLRVVVPVVVAVDVPVDVKVVVVVDVWVLVPVFVLVVLVVDVGVDVSWSAAQYRSGGRVMKVRGTHGDRGAARRGQCS